MNSSFTPLQALHTTARDPLTPVAFYRDSAVTWQQFLIDIFQLREQLKNMPDANCALFHEESYTFSVALLSLLSLGKTVYLPANNTLGTADLLRQDSANVNSCKNFIGDWPDANLANAALAIQTNVSASHLSGEISLPALTGKLVLFTSGSTGEPKAIVKTLAQLDAELHTHAQLWGERWRNARVLATVSHQHIYGLLFKVLGPLCGARCFHSSTFRDPANLLAQATENCIWIASPAHLQRLQNDWPWNPQYLVATFCSGGVLHANAAQHHRELGGSWPIEIYGSSETGGIAVRTQANGNSAWSPFPNIDFRIADTLEIRSPHLADNDWFVTADQATVCEGGFELGARADRIVKIEGKRIALPEIESRLNAHEWIVQARTVVIERARQRIGVVAELSDSGKQQLETLGKHSFSQQLRIYLQQYFEPIVLPRLWRFAPLPIDSQGKVSTKVLAAFFENTEEKSEKVILPIIHNRLIDSLRCELVIQIPEDLIYLQGHFPGVPVVPGVALLRWVEYFAREYLSVVGICKNLEVIKFKQLVRPGDTLTLTLVHQAEKNKLLFTFASASGEHSSGRLVFEANGSEATAFEKSGFETNGFEVDHG